MKKIESQTIVSENDKTNSPSESIGNDGNQNKGESSKSQSSTTTTTTNTSGSSSTNNNTNDKKKSSNNNAGSNPSGAAPGSRRYFVIKSVGFDNFDISREKGIWSTQIHNEEKFNLAFEASSFKKMNFKNNNTNTNNNSKSHS